METSTRSLLLVSKSPRRRRLLEWLGLPYECTSIEVDESYDASLAPADLVADITRRKTIAAHEAFLDVSSVVLCCDTLVFFEGEVLGKPKDEADARETLARLSGREHTVVTGLGLWFPEDTRPLIETVSRVVSMKDLDVEGVDAWIDRGEYLGCAGSYNIEAHLAEVSENECYQNVVGLPLCHLYQLLASRLNPSSPVCPCNQSLQRTCQLSPNLIS